LFCLLISQMKIIPHLLKIMIHSKRNSLIYKVHNWTQIKHSIRIKYELRIKLNNKMEEIISIAKVDSKTLTMMSQNKREAWQLCIKHQVHHHLHLELQHQLQKSQQLIFLQHTLLCMYHLLTKQ